MPPVLLAGLACLLALSPPLSAQEGKLDEVREEVRDGDEDEHADEPEDGDEWLWDALDDPFDEESWLDACLDGAVEWVVLLPFCGPRTALGDFGFAPARFQEYPGRSGPGYWIAPADVRAEKCWSIRPRAELGSDLDDLERTGLALLLEHEDRFGLDLAWSRFREDVAAGTDELDLADLNLVYRFAQGPRAAFRAGLGVNYLNDAFDEEFGLDSTYAAEFLPRGPLALGLEADLGTLGDATLRHLRLSVGCVLERFELYAAWDAWEIDSADLDTLAVGLRAWF